jgi:cell division septation protein DedD
LEVTVLGLPTSGLHDVGLFFPESEPGAPSNATGFAIILPDDEAKSLSRNPRAILIHNLKQPATVNPMKFRVNARTPLAPDSPESQLYYEVGIALDVSSNAGSNRSIVLSTSSVVQIRRGPAPAGSVGPLLLETQPIKHDLQVQEGKSILLGGFFNPTDAARLPDLPAMPESPLLNYVFSKAPRRSDDNEIVVLLTPRRLGGIVEPIPAPAVANPAITAVPVLSAPEAPPVREVPALKIVIPELAFRPATVNQKPVLASVTMPPAIVSPPPSSFVAVPKPQAPFYTVQAGAFQSRTKAEALAARLGEKFGEVFVDEVPTGVTPYRVRVGRLPNVKSARLLQASLADQGFDTYIVAPDSR